MSLIIPIIFITIITIVCLHFRGERSPETIQGIATLGGIFGTFIGIVLALSGLDFQNIGTSIQALLNGIYPAFLSSLGGVGISLWVYLYPEFWKQQEETLDREQGTESQILRELKNLNKNITGNSETSLNAQMLELRDAVTRKQDELKHSFDMFAEKMAENNMKALEDVIKDFNTKLQEQFGENFKQLNEAVGKLLGWQENYRETIEKTNIAVERMLKSLESSKESMQVSASALEEITKSVNSFKENADALKTQLEEVRNTTGEINEFANGLSGAANTIKDNMGGIMDRALEDLGQNLKGISEALVRDYQQIQQVFERMKDSQ